MNPLSTVDHCTRAIRSVVALPAMWLSELAALLPTSFRALWHDAPNQIDIVLDPSGVFRVRGSDLPVDASQLSRLAARRRVLTAATIHVPASKCFVRQLRLPRAALDRGDAVLKIEMEQTTVLRAAAVLSAWYEQPGADRRTANIQHVILKRTTLDPLMNDLKAAQVPLSGVMVASDGIALNLLPAAERHRDLATTWLAKAARAFVLLVTIWGAALLVWRLQAQHSALELVRSELRAATLRAQASAKAEEQAALSASRMKELRRRKAQEPAFVIVWDELTRVLPTSSWLTDLRLEQSSIQFDGFAVNAADLISVLSNSSLFSNAAFVSPVTRDPQRAVERFQIKLDISATGPTRKAKASP